MGMLMRVCWMIPYMASDGETVRLYHISITVNTANCRKIYLRLLFHIKCQRFELVKSRDLHTFKKVDDKFVYGQTSLFFL